ncbi:sensor histidine kinase [Bacillus sp. DTU_2020_1000418_1_SI_GHA_SEK_038]|uniref:sensor histidine kinase n=1 Tax=Bacillus sp. DTU_2020_1000418_1_SI_GHA_SEK_038 TaxID=3077585 RepID=UPI0028E6164F|nr:sensor histidine kinase [Bacillus sp. DTU_2020_1000418_1_SI_GHA_SEK_038]WNS75103.1 sensor histidine kinase [Bacillus sp. DTU_2020_1000418_1_SI_GHA_SEK_038]
MSNKKFDTKTLDMILEQMVEAVGSSKDEVFQIGEQCRKEHLTLSDELKEVKALVKKSIDEGDRLEAQTRFARKKLSEVSKHFKDYSEAEVRDAYEKAHRLQMDYSMNQQLEKQLRDRRDDIERRLVGLSETIERAEHLISQISVVMNYLMSDLKQVGEMLENAKLKQEFGLKIIEAQEEERKRLSREIHDGPAQMMANVMMRSDLIERVYKERGGPAAIGEIRDLKKMVRSALYEVRRIIYDLRPMALDDLGLVPTLKKYLATIEEYHKSIRIEFSNIKEEKRLPGKYEVALFRLIQESVQNALKHADANTITVRLEIDKSKVTVVIKDDGKGFDIQEKKHNSFGIMGMRERVELLEGQMAIDSAVGKGTIVIIQVPLNM